MRKSFLLLPLVGAFAYLTLSSNSGGKSGNLTGSPSGSTGCGSCHGNSAVTGVTVTFELDSAGVPVTHYKAGMVYTLKMIGTNTTTFTLPKFGYQMVTVMGTGSTQAGTFSTVPTGSNTHTSGGLTVLGQTTPNSPSTGTGATGTVYTLSAGWTAPVAGSGTVSVHAVLNAVNNNGGDDNGDKWNTGTASFQEWTVSHVGVAEVDGQNNAVAYPSPVTADLNIALGNTQSGTSQVSVFDINGRLVAQQSINTAVANQVTTFGTDRWAQGIYNVVITSGNTSKTITVVKK